MSIITDISYKAATGASTGTSPGKLSRSYSNTFTVQVTNEQVGPLDILAAFQANPNYPWNGRPYYFGNGGFDATAVCKSLSVPTRVAGSLDLWNVEASYESEEGPEDDEEKRPDEDGKKKTDPEFWHDEIEVGFTQITVPVDVATFEGFENPGIDNPFLKKGRVGGVVNSALVPFRPKPEMEIDVKVIRISRNVKSWNDDLANKLQGTVNKSEVTIRKPKYRFSTTFGAHTGRIKIIGGRFAVRNGKPYWNINIEVHINPLGWRGRILDCGLDRIWTPGVPDGRGGTISASDAPAAAMPHTRPIKDTLGEPISEPVLFNGRGWPKENKSDPDVIMLYSYYEETDWSKIPW